MILDEAHERTLHTDIIVGLLRKVNRVKCVCVCVCVCARVCDWYVAKSSDYEEKG